MKKGRPKRVEDGARCPKCGRTETIKAGKQNATQRWKCQFHHPNREKCVKKFSEGKNEYFEKAYIFSSFHRMHFWKDQNLDSLTLTDISLHNGLSRPTVRALYKEWKVLVKQEEKVYKEKLLSDPVFFLRELDITLRQVDMSFTDILVQMVTDHPETIQESGSELRFLLIKYLWPELRWNAYRETNQIWGLAKKPVTIGDKLSWSHKDHYSIDSSQQLDREQDCLSTYPNIYEHFLQEEISMKRATSYHFNEKSFDTKKSIRANRTKALTEYIKLFNHYTELSDNIKPYKLSASSLAEKFLWFLHRNRRLIRLVEKYLVENKRVSKMLAYETLLLSKEITIIEEDQKKRINDSKKLSPIKPSLHQ